MRYVERGGTIGTYSSGVKMTLKVRITPMETIILLQGFRVKGDFDKWCHGKTVSQNIKRY